MVFILNYKSKTHNDKAMSVYLDLPVSRRGNTLSTGGRLRLPRSLSPVDWPEDTFEDRASAFCILMEKRL